jgi:hypothetical protein
MDKEWFVIKWSGQMRGREKKRPLYPLYPKTAKSLFIDYFTLIMDFDSDSSSSSSDIDVRQPKQKRSKKNSEKSHKHVEHYNVQKLIWLIHHWKELGFKEDVSTYRKMLLDVRCTKETWPYGEQEVVYERKGLPFGRLVPSTLSFILMNRRVRQTVADFKYADIDFVNCHFYLYCFICEKYEIPSFKWSFLQEYIEKRETILNDCVEANLELGFTKEDFKAWFLSVLNGMQVTVDYSKWILTEFMETFLTGVKYLQQVLVKSIEQEPRYEHNRKYIVSRDGASAHNVECKVISLVLMDYEDRMRDALSTYVRNHHFNWSVECYDGGMSYLALNRQNIYERLNLDDAKFYIKEKLGIKCDIKFKSMNEHCVAIPDLQSVTYEDLINCIYMEGDSYEAIKWRFEKNNFFCQRDVQYYTENENSIAVYSDGEFQNKYKDIKYMAVSKSGKKPKKFITEWMQDDTKRKYEIVGFYPPGFNEYEQTDKPNWCYSTWKGLACERIVPDSNDHSNGVMLLRNHILYLCNDNNEYQQFIEKYIKHMLVHPGRKTDMVIAFKAVQGGEGKNTFFEIVKNMIGTQYSITSGNAERDWFGDFNGCIHNRLWVHMEEMSKDVLRKHQKQFLSYVTSKTDTINLKGGKKIPDVPSFCNYFITFNSQGVEFFPGLKRRLWIHELTSPVRGTQYYNELYAAMNNPQVIRGYYDYLMDMVDISGFKPSDESMRPMTPYMTKLWGHEDSPKDRFDTFVHNCILEWFNDKFHPNVHRISLLEFFEMYSAKCKADNVPAAYIGVIQNFSKRLEIVFPVSCGCLSRTVSKGKNYVTVDVDACMKYLVEEKKWLKWEDLGFEEQYDDLLYKVFIPCKKQCAFKVNRAHMSYQMIDEARAINWFRNSGKTEFKHICECNGHYQLNKF